MPSLGLRALKGIASVRLTDTLKGHSDYPLTHACMGNDFQKKPYERKDCEGSPSSGVTSPRRSEAQESIRW